MTVQDRSGRIVYANPAGVRMIGFETVDELMATPVEQVLERFELFDEAGAPFPIERLPGRQALIGERPQTTVIRFRIRATGEEHFAAVDAAPIIGADGTITHAVNTFHDITAVKRGELTLRFLAEAGDLLATSLDYEETLRSVARLAVPAVADWCVIDLLDEGELRRVAIHHADPEKLHLAEEFQRRWPPRREAESGIYEVLLSGEANLLPELTDEQLQQAAAARDEAEEYLRVLRGLGLRSVIVAPLIGREETIGALTFVTAESGRVYTDADLTLAKLLARRAAIAVENARLFQRTADAVATRDRFLSMAAHELLTPVTVVRGYAQALARQATRASTSGGASALDPARLERAAQQLELSSTRLTRLVNDLLDVSRIQAEALAMEPAEVDLREVLAAAAESTRAHGEGRYPEQLRLETEPGSSPVVGFWDPVRIEQVAFNVIDNALKYSRPGGTVRVSVYRDGDEAEFAVADAGIGIPPDQLEAVFEPFYRAASDVSGVTPGIGMGLAICREIVDRHGGWIRAEQGEGGVGTVVRVRLPLRPHTSEAPATPEQTR